MILYTIKKSLKAKNIRITIKPDGSVVVTLPYRVSESKADLFVQEKKDWIQKNVERLQKRKDSNGDVPRMLPKGTKKEFDGCKEVALALVMGRLTYFNTMYGYTWNKVSIKNVSSRWGSCSKNGNLNFSYKIALLPPLLADYIIVHELCHLGEFNHGKNFWKLVEKTIPEYKKLRRELKGVI